MKCPKCGNKMKIYMITRNSNIYDCECGNKVTRERICGNCVNYETNYCDHLGIGVEEDDEPRCVGGYNDKNG